MSWAARWRSTAVPVALAATHERALDGVPLEALQEHAIDGPLDPGGLI